MLVIERLSVLVPHPRHVLLSPLPRRQQEIRHLKNWRLCRIKRHCRISAHRTIFFWTLRDSAACTLRRAAWGEPRA